MLGILLIILVWKYTVSIKKFLFKFIPILKNKKVNTREQFLPDPELDPVQIVFWSLQTQYQRVSSNGYQGNYIGIIAVKSFDISKVGLSNTSKTLF